MAETTEATAPALAPPTLPVELWHSICHFLRLDAETGAAETRGLKTPPYHALHCLGQTSRFLHQLTISVRSSVIYIWATKGRIRKRPT